MSMQDELPGPIDVEGYVESHEKEFLRMWHSEEDGGVCFVRPEALHADPFVFGMMLVDAVRHGSKAYAGAVGISEQEAYRRILQGLQAELEHSTTEINQVSG